MPPRAESTAPRNMLPPPTTTAIWMPLRAAVVISLAMWPTVSGEMPSGSPPANASPDSLTTTRRQGGWVLQVCLTGGLRGAVAHEPSSRPGGGPTRRCRSVPRPGRPFLPVGRPGASGAGRESASLADLVTREGGHVDLALRQDLLDRLLRVLDERLLQQHDLLEEGVQPALGDLRDGLLGLALVAGDLLRDPALL